MSLNRFVKWLAPEQAEGAGADIFAGFAGAETLVEGSRVVGVRTGDRGIDRQGQKKATFEPGVDIRAKVTIFAEGVRGHLTKRLLERLSLDDGRIPQVYAVGIKELWELPPDRLPPGEVIHTMGFPLRSEEFGGGFVYALPEGRVSVGFVVGARLPGPDVRSAPGVPALQASPPRLGAADAGGTMVRYGAKALPEGGWHAIPRCHMDGAVIVGDAAGFLNSLRLKGIHLAMRSGMHAADAAFEALQAGDTSEAGLARFQQLVDEGPVRRELYPVRNVHQSFSHGLLAGLAYSGLSLLTGGWWYRDPMPGHAGHERMRTLEQYGTRVTPIPATACRSTAR